MGAMLCHGPHMPSWLKGQCLRVAGPALVTLSVVVRLAAAVTKCVLHLRAWGEDGHMRQGGTARGGTAGRSHGAAGSTHRVAG